MIRRLDGFMLGFLIPLCIISIYSAMWTLAELKEVKEIQEANFVDLEEVKEIQEANFECQKKWSAHWEEFTMWQIRNSDTITEHQYNKKWKQHAMDSLILDAKCMNKLDSLHNDG